MLRHCSQCRILFFVLSLSSVCLGQTSTANSPKEPVTHNGSQSTATKESEALFQSALKQDFGSTNSTDFEKVLELYERSAKAGHYEARGVLAVVYTHGYLGVKIDHAHAYLLANEAAKAGSSLGKYCLGRLTERLPDAQGAPQPDPNPKGERFYRSAADGLQKLSKSGNAYAQNYLGRLYFDGMGGLVGNKLRAVQLYQKAAAQGLAAAENNLASLYLEGGSQLEKNAGKAADLFKLAANNGSAYARCNFGLMLLNGTGRTQDDKAAVSMFQKSARQGDPYGQHNLAVMLEDGRGGLGSNDEKAITFYRLSAKQGYYQAQNNLALMYLEGRGGLGRDAREALRLFNLAADQRFELAQRNAQVIRRRLRNGL